MRRKIGILMENRFIDKEILYYSERFKEEELEVVFLTRLWGNDKLTFTGLELGLELVVDKSFEFIGEPELSSYAAIIIPAGYVSDYLLYSEVPKVHSPAVKFIEMIMKDQKIIKGFICHSLWIASPLKDSFKGRKATCHNNIISHVENTGMIYENTDIYVDNDLLTARTGGDFAAFAAELIRRIKE